MEIIKNNFKRSQPEWPKIATCHECSSQMAVEKTDFRYEQFVFSQREIERVEVFTCPCCNAIVPISWAKLMTPRKID